MDVIGSKMLSVKRYISDSISLQTHQHSLPTQYFCMFFFCPLQNFSKINLFRKFLRVSNSLDPGQARHFVGHDLGPNCLQKLSADGG